PDTAREGPARSPAPVSRRRTTSLSDPGINRAGGGRRAAERIAYPLGGSPDDRAGRGGADAAALRPGRRRPARAVPRTPEIHASTGPARAWRTRDRPTRRSAVAYRGGNHGDRGIHHRH